MTTVHPLNDDGINQPLEDDTIETCGMGRVLFSEAVAIEPCPLMATGRLVLTDEGNQIVPLCDEHYQQVIEALDRQDMRQGVADILGGLSPRVGDNRIQQPPQR